MTLNRTAKQVLGLLLTAVIFAVVWWVEGGGTDSGDGSTPARADETTSVTTTYTGDSSPTPTFTEESVTAPTVAAQDSIDPQSGLHWVDLGDLPAEAKETVALIDSGGPFPYPEHDGKVFQNREEILPLEDYGYYREYTVPTPGSPDRGARRIVTGMAGEFYWTSDHYASFERIAL